MTKTPMTLGGKIRALRLAKGMTQGELAGREITPGLISQIESDRVAPSERVVNLLTKALDVNPSELLSEIELRHRQTQLLRDARDLLDRSAPHAAKPLLDLLVQASISYVTKTELDLEIARLYEQLGMFPEAETLYERVSARALVHHEWMIGASSLNRQGELHLANGRYILAYHCFLQALWYLDQSTQPIPQAVFTTRKNLSITAYRLGNTDQSFDFARSAFSDVKTSGSRVDCAELCHLLSVLSMENKSGEEALAYAREAISIYSSLGQTYALTDAYMNLAIIQRERGYSQEAVSLLPQLITDYHKQGRMDALSNAWSERAQCEISIAQYEDAARSVERALALSKEESPERAEALRVQGLLLRATAQYDVAFLTLKNAAARFEALQLLNSAVATLEVMKDMILRQEKADDLFVVDELIARFSLILKQRLRVTEMTVLPPEKKHV